MVEKEKLERLRAKRGGNRGAFTKKLKDEKTLLDGIKENQDIDDIQKGQLKVLRQFLEQKKRYYTSTTNKFWIYVQFKKLIKK